MASLRILIPVLSIFGAISAQQGPCFEVGHGEAVYHWPNGLQVNWPNRTFAAPHLNKKIVPIGIKVYKERVFIQVPRWLGNSHPLNMAVARRPEMGQCVGTPTTPNLDPYPSWEMNKLGCDKGNSEGCKCSAFQYVQSMEIESDGTAWIPDNGRQFNVPSKCKPKLVIMDLNTDTVESVHYFPESVFSSKKGFLTDIVLDVTKPDDKFAFISDSNEAAIIVYSMKQYRSWRVEHETFKAINTVSLTPFKVNPPRSIEIKDNNVNGIAITSRKSGSERVFYSPITSKETFEVSTWALEEESIATDPVNLNSFIRKFTDKPSKTDGLIIDAENNLYMLEIETNAVSLWNVSDSSQRSVLYQDDEINIWPDTAAIDYEEGFLWVTTRGWPIDSYSRVIRIQTGEKSGLDTDD